VGYESPMSSPSTNLDGEVETKAVPEGGEVVNDERILGQQQLECVFDIENTGSSDQVRLGGGDVESGDEQPLLDDKIEERVNVGGVATVD